MLVIYLLAPIRSPHLGMYLAPIRSPHKDVYLAPIRLLHEGMYLAPIISQHLVTLDQSQRLGNESRPNQIAALGYGPRTNHIAA